MKIFQVFFVLSRMFQLESGKKIVSFALTAKDLPNA